MRRLRQKQYIRELIRECDVRVRSLIQPIFVEEGLEGKKAIEALPGIYRLPVSSAGDEVAKLESLGIRAVLLFGVTSRRDGSGSRAYAQDGPVQMAIREIRRKSAALIFTDLCMCEYTSHGHCGVLKGEIVDNDATLEVYGRIAISQAEAGADMLAPSGMMDGQVRAIRNALDDAGYRDTGIMAYASKTASSLYGPFREAAGSAPSFGDRKGYQLDYGNGRQAMREMELDAEEGADILMIKPALPCLDLIHQARKRFCVPLAAYSVSGEYAMLRAAASMGWLDYREATLEVLSSIFRAGADVVVTYAAGEVASWLRE